MLAYHGDPDIKEAFLRRVRAHQAADQLRQGYGYWQEDKDGVVRGCAVGCTIESSHHGDYPPLLGIPVAIAYLEDMLFENMTPHQALKWPAEFLEAIPVGADLGRVNAQMARWLIAWPAYGLRAQVAALLQGDNPQRRTIEGLLDRLDHCYRVAEEGGDGRNVDTNVGGELDVLQDDVDYGTRLWGIVRAMSHLDGFYTDGVADALEKVCDNTGHLSTERYYALSRKLLELLIVAPVAQAVPV